MAFRETKVYDVLVASPLFALYGLGIWVRLLPDAIIDVQHLPAPMACLHLFRELSNFAYISLIAATFFFRRMPLAKSTWLPRAVALVSAYFYMARFNLPRPPESIALDLVSTLLTSAGTVAAMIVLVWLRRSFSILPEARVLVTQGPYRIVRHPLYVTEEIANLGAMLQFVQPWSLLIEIMNVALQLWRMSFEERILLRTFPNYAAYAARTRRVIPGVY